MYRSLSQKGIGVEEGRWLDIPLFILQTHFSNTIINFRAAWDKCLSGTHNYLRKVRRSQSIQQPNNISQVEIGGTFWEYFKQL